MNRAKPALITLTVLAAARLGAAQVDNPTPGPLIRISGTSPFAGHTEDGIATQSGVNFLHSEVEPWVAVNPVNPNNIVGIWQQDRWSNGGARGFVAAASFDGGGTWQAAPIPKITLCSGGTAANGGGFQRATDPWVSFGPSGVVHQLSLSFNDSNFANALLASRSSDGGLTWTDPVTVFADPDNATLFNDKQSITADPYNSNYVYATWDRLVFANPNANVKAAFHTRAFQGPTWFARSTDGGATWEPARPIFDPGQQAQTLGNQIVVLPNGDLVNVFALYYTRNKNGLQGAWVAIVRSTDRGQTWSGPVIVGSIGTIGVADPDTGDYVRSSEVIPDIAVNPASGALYVVWQDARFSGFQNDGIALSTSVDGGFTWSTALKVNQTPTNLAAGNQQAFLPAVHVAAGGVVAVSYHDFRNNTPDPGTLPTDCFVVHYHPGANWAGEERRLTTTSFDMRQAPIARGFFVGDYVGLASSGSNFVSLFCQPHDADPCSAFVRRLNNP